MIDATEEEFKTYCENRTVKSVDTVCGETEIKFDCGRVAVISTSYDDRYGWETSYEVLQLKEIV